MIKGAASDTVIRLEQSLSETLAGDASVRWAYLFGSAARGETFNDLDVAIMLADSHFYSAVDYDRVFDALGELADLERFAAIVTTRIT